MPSLTQQWENMDIPPKYRPKHRRHTSRTAPKAGRLNLSTKQPRKEIKS